MPRSKKQPSTHWDIPDPQGFLRKGGVVRRMVNDYKQAKGIGMPQAIAELIEAGYTSTVGILPGAPLDGSPPHGTMDGSNIFEDMENRGESGAKRKLAA